MQAAAASLRRLAALDMERIVLFTALGRIIENGRESLLDCARFIEELSREARKLKNSGYSVEEIIEALFGPENDSAFRSERTNGQFTAENLINSVLEID